MCSDCIPVLVHAGQAQESPSAPGSEQKADALRLLEEERTSAKNKADYAQLEQYAAEDWLFASPDGELVTKDEYFAELKSGNLNHTSTRVDELSVRLFGDTAIVTVIETEEGTYRGSDISGSYRVLDVWLKRDGRWRVVATQATRMEKK